MIKTNTLRSEKTAPRRSFVWFRQFRARKLVALILFSVFLSFMPTIVSAKSVCSDGWISSSSGRGTCSWHGGIAGGPAFVPAKYQTYKLPTDFRVKRYSNCSKLRKQYAFGVTNTFFYSWDYYKPWYFPALYKKNAKLDTNRDGVACEIVMAKSSPTPAPTPTPTPTATATATATATLLPKLGTKARPAVVGQTVESSGFEFTLLGQPKELSQEVCSYVVIRAIEGCLYQRNEWNLITKANGIDPAASTKWVSLDLRVKRNPGSVYFYLGSWQYTLFSNTYRANWDSTYAPNFDYADLKSFSDNETRTISMIFLVPKNADFSKSAFGILDFIETPSIESRSRYYYLAQ